MNELINTLRKVVESVMSFDNGISGYCVCCDQSNSHSKECPIAKSIELLSSNGRFVNTNGNHGGPLAGATAYDVTSDPRVMSERLFSGGEDCVGPITAVATNFSMSSDIRLKNQANFPGLDLVSIKSLNCECWPTEFPKNKKAIISTHASGDFTMRFSILEGDILMTNNKHGKSFNIFGYKVITTGRLVASVNGIDGVKFVTLWGAFK